MKLSESTKESPAMDWYEDRYQSIYISRNRWFVTALAAGGLAILQALALVLLIPLKTAVPFLIKEELSGAITTVRPLMGDESVTYNESVKKFFLSRYVTCRETFDLSDLKENYHAVELMSDDNETTLFNSYIAPTNPQNPFKLYNQNTKRFIRPKSITFLNNQTALIRFTAIEKRSNAEEKQSQWIATVGFRFGQVPAVETERLVNPLGFLVTNYRVDQEVIP
jgi:type IV secretion system protein VirB8